MGFERVYSYQGNYCIVTGICTNGFIIFAYPHKKEKNKMFIVKLMNEFVHGVLWVCDDDGISTNYDLIDKDEELTKLNEETRKLFDSYYEFDSHDQACWLNEELERKTKDKMLELIRKIKIRLSEINDGSFIVEDYETERLEKL